MKFNQQSVRNSGARKALTLTLSVVMLLTLAGRVGAAVVLQDNFSGDSGSIVPGTMTIVPQIGSGVAVAGADSAQITSSLGTGGSAGLQYFDTGPGNSTITYTPTVALTDGLAHFAFDILGKSGSPGPLASDRPFINVDLKSSDSGFASAHLYYNQFIGISDDVTYFHTYALGGTQVENTFYHVDLALNLSAATMTVSVSGPNIALTTVTQAFSVANWNPSQGLTTIEFTTGNTNWATTPENYTTGAYAVLDNVLLETLVPEPSSVMLLGLGGLLVFRRRSPSYGGQGRGGRTVA